MNKSGVLFAAALLFCAAYACVSPPSIEVGGKNLSYPGGAGPVTAQELDSAMAENYGREWSTLNLSPAEKNSLAEFVSNGYSAKKMSASEYEGFLNDAAELNSKAEDCAFFEAVAYANGFAGYVLNPFSDKSPSCSLQPKPDCPTAFNSFVNDLTTRAAEDGGDRGGAPGVAPVAGESFGTLGAGTQSGQEAEGPQAAFSWISRLLPATPLAILAIGLTAIVVFSVLMRRQQAQTEMEFEEVETHRALSSSTRMELMRELSQRDLTPTDLSARVGKSKATVVEHLERLMDAELVEKVEREGKKFVFYRMTPKGKMVLRRAG